MSRFVSRFIILLTIFCLFFSFVLTTPAEAVGGKVASQMAKKAAKELIKDSAVNTAVKMTINFAMPPEMLDKHKALESGYDAVCLPKSDGKKDTECKNPVQVKKNFTSADKKSIADRAEVLLDKKMNNTGWIKFLDWFVPIIAVGVGLKYLEAKLDPDTENLFNEVALQTLEDLGFIKPLPKKTPTIKDDNGNVYDPTKPPDDFELPSDGQVNIPESKVLKSVEIDFSNSGKSSSVVGLDLSNVNMINTGIIIDLAHGRENVIDGIYKDDSHIRLETSGHSGFGYISPTHPSLSFNTTKVDYRKYDDNTYNVNTKAYLNGKYITGRDWASSSKLEFRDSIYRDSVYSILRNVKRIVIETATITSFGYATRYHFIDKNNNILTYEINFKEFSQDASLNIGVFSLTLYHGTLNGIDFKIRTQVVTNVRHFEITNYVPDITKINVQPLDLSKFKTDTEEGTKHKIIPPSVIPLELPDGTPVTIDDDGSFRSPDGTPVTDEESITVKDPIRSPEDDAYLDPEGNKLPDPAPPQTPTPSPGETDLKPNLPWEIIIALLDMLRSILSFMARLFAFILTLPLIEAKPIDNHIFAWFRDAEFFGIKIYNVISTIATLSLSLLIYKIVRRVF